VRVGPGREDTTSCQDMLRLFTIDWRTMLPPCVPVPLSQHKHGGVESYQDAQFFLKCRHVHGESMILTGLSGCFPISLGTVHFDSYSRDRLLHTGRFLSGNGIDRSAVAASHSGPPQFGAMVALNVRCSIALLRTDATKCRRRSVTEKRLAIHSTCESLQE
jgi:hypothetical protein